MNITIENIKEYAVPLDVDMIEWFFTDDNGNHPTQEHMDQIFVFKGNASKFLWDFESKFAMPVEPRFYKNISSFQVDHSETPAIKKYLFNLSIPFSHWVFIAEQPYCGFMLTWKMVIKYCDNLFRDDQLVWDKTLNWKLERHHDGLFTFGKDLLYNSNTESDKRWKAINEMQKRNY